MIVRKATLKREVGRPAKKAGPKPRAAAAKKAKKAMEEIGSEWRFGGDFGEEEEEEEEEDEPGMVKAAPKC